METRNSFWSTVPGMLVMFFITVTVLVTLGAGVRIINTYITARTDEVVRPIEDTNYDSRKARSERFNNAYYGLQGILDARTTVNNQIAQLETLYGADKQKWPLDAKQRYEQLLTSRMQYDTTYAAACNAYLAAWDDEFKAQAAPKDLPRQCPK